MENKEIQFYHSKVKLIILIIILVTMISLSSIGLIVAISDKEILISFIIIILLSILLPVCIPACLKLFRENPAIIITDTYIRLDSNTRSELTIYQKDIAALSVTPYQFSKIVRVQLYNEQEYIKNLSRYNKIRLLPNTLFGTPVYTISLQVLTKKDQLKLLAAVDVIKDNLGDQDVSIVTCIKEKEQVLFTANLKDDLLHKYGNQIKVDRKINSNYFKKAYLSSFFFFIFSFLLFYLLPPEPNNSYLSFIIICFMLYPLTKAVIDLIYGFAFKEFVENNTGPTSHAEKLKWMFDLAWFHLSFILAPLSLIILLIRAAFLWRKQKKNNVNE